MLERSLIEEYSEYEIQDSKEQIEQEFYKYFLDFMENIKFDMVDHQIIISPGQCIIEIRIKMNKLGMCFANRHNLNIIYENSINEINKINCFVLICMDVVRLVKQYAEGLCFNKEDK